MESETSGRYHVARGAGYPVRVKATKPGYLNAYQRARARADCEDDIVQPGPLGMSRTLALWIVRGTRRPEVREAWIRRERERKAAEQPLDGPAMREIAVIKARLR